MKVVRGQIPKTRQFRLFLAAQGGWFLLEIAFLIFRFLDRPRRVSGFSLEAIDRYREMTDNVSHAMLVGNLIILFAFVWYLIKTNPRA